LDISCFDFKGMVTVMGLDRFARTCSWNFLNHENRLLAQVRGSQFFPTNTFYL